MSKPRNPLAGRLPFVALVVCISLQATAEPGVSADASQGRVVLAPINLGITPSLELAPGLKPVWQEIIALAAESGHKIAILEDEGADSLWREASVEARVMNPEADVHDIHSAFARRVAEQADFVAMVFPSLVVRQVQWSNNIASWDGVKRGVSTPRSDAIFDGDLGSVHFQDVDGNLAAASLHVKVIGSDGAVQFEGVGGLALLQRLAFDPTRTDNPVVAVLRDEAFSDSVQLREGIVAAFAAAPREAN